MISKLQRCIVAPMKRDRFGVQVPGPDDRDFSTRRVLGIVVNSTLRLISMTTCSILQYGQLSYACHSHDRMRIRTCFMPEEAELPEC